MLTRATGGRVQISAKVRRLARIALVCVAVWGAGDLAAEMRTFTDAQGRTITAEIMDTTEVSVRIRRDDGRKFEIGKSTLSEDDRAYIATWEKNRAFAFGGVEIRARRVRLDSERTLTRSSVNKEELWCYKITVENKARARLDGVVVEWRVFHVDDSAHADRDELPLKRQQGRSAIATLEAGTSTEVQTTPLDLHITRLKPGRRYTGTNKRSIEDSLEGIWVRVTQGREVLAEMAMPTALMTKEQW